MWIIAGLGNPGEKYDGTRHNAGFEVIEKLAEAHQISVTEREGRAFVGKGRIAGQRVLLVKPQTFMNLSGESIRKLKDYYKVEEDQVLIIYDDVSLEPGKIRIRKKGSAGGHNGIKSIIAHLGTQTFPRVKVGVGKKPPAYDLADYVLGRFSRQEKEKMCEGYEAAAAATEKIVAGEMESAMNLFNRKGKAEEVSE